ncbi:MAG: AAA family ATPase [Gammaproteobacteria bacterium]|nr:AAA family ATPase [Gammaproteobacteria bacterium]
MYEEYFGLERPPFKITPDTSLFYDGGKRGDILAALVYAIHRGEGIVKVVGEVGSGKTMLCRMLQLKLPDTVEIVYIANPSVSADDILFVIAHELSLPVVKEASKHEVMHMLQDYLLQRHMENKQVVLFVEEAQGMPLDTLEEIRLLSNLETDENKLLQIILFGQPELDQNLAQQSIRQLRERITHNFELEPLTRDEIHYYLNFRMRQVGYTGPELINNTVAKKVEQHSAGLLRRINIIADKILLSAFAEGTHNLSSKHVTAAVNDSSFAQEVERKTSPARWRGLLLLVALIFALYLSRDHWLPLVAIDMPAEEQLSMQDNPPISPENDPVITPAAAASSESAALDAPLLDEQSQLETDVVEEPATDQPEVDDAAIDSDSETMAIAAQSSGEESPQEPDDAIQAEAADIAVTQTGTDAQSMEIPDPPDSPRVQENEAVNPQQAQHEIAQDESPSTLDNTDLAANEEYDRWLNIKLQQSREWLANAGRDKLSIQVMMRKQSAARELVYYLLNEWPFALSNTYLFEVVIEDKIIYRVFYSEFDAFDQARAQIDRLPDSVKANLPYVHSVYRMRQNLL